MSTALGILNQIDQLENSFYNGLLLNLSGGFNCLMKYCYFREIDNGLLLNLSEGFNCLMKYCYFSEIGEGQVIGRFRKFYVALAI